MAAPTCLSLFQQGLGCTSGYSAGGAVASIDGHTHHINRFTAFGGNLGSAHVYVVARDVKGLRPGVYRYDLLEHRLHAVPRDFEAATVDATSISGSHKWLGRRRVLSRRAARHTASLRVGGQGRSRTVCPRQRLW